MLQTCAACKEEEVSSKDGNQLLPKGYKVLSSRRADSELDLPGRAEL